MGFFAGLFNAPLHIYMIAIGTSLIIGMFTFLIYSAFKEEDPNKIHDQQLADLMLDDFDENKPVKINLMYKWNQYWNDRFKSLGISKYAEGKDTAGRDVIILWIAAAVLLFALTRIIFLAIAAPTVLLYLTGAISKNISNKKEEQLNNQLPGFIFAMKANVQANQTPEQAIMKVVDNMPSPLYEDLVILKNRILANGSFVDALDEVRSSTKSRDLRFLCSCMIQAANSGANMENQLTVIQKVLEARRKVTDETEKAIRQASPAMWIASFVIPGSFIFTLFFDQSAKNFWFVNPLSYIVLVIVGILWAIGIWLSKKLTDSIRNL